MDESDPMIQGDTDRIGTGRALSAGEGSVVDARYAALMTQHQRALYGYIMSLVGRPNDADDVLQEVNVVLWRKSGEFDHERPFLPWACSVAYYEVLADRKRRQRDRHVPVADEVMMQIAAEATHHAEHLEARLEAMRSCLDKLPAHLRELIARRYEQSRSIDAIATDSDRSAAAIYTALHRVRRSLLDCIERTLGGQRP